MALRPEIAALVQMGQFPAEEDQNASVELVTRYQTLIESIVTPVNDEEAEALSTLFGSDTFFGLAETLVHIVESAPGWPLKNVLKDSSGNFWIASLRTRLMNAGYSHETS